jgi:hypothetical protein
MVLCYNLMRPPSLAEASLCCAWLYMITAQKTITYQYNFFILQVAVHNTKQPKHNDTENKLVAHSKRRRHLHYVQYTERSGPLIVSPRMPPAVNTPDRWAASTDKWGFCTCYVLHVGCSWSQSGCEIFLWTVMCVLLANCALKHRVQPQCWRVRIARPVQNGNWYSRLAQRVRDTKLYITGTNINATYILLWEHCFNHLMPELNPSEQAQPAWIFSWGFKFYCILNNGIWGLQGADHYLICLAYSWHKCTVNMQWLQLQ